MEKLYCYDLRTIVEHTETGLIYYDKTLKCKETESQLKATLAEYAKDFDILFCDKQKFMDLIQNEAAEAIVKHNYCFQRQDENNAIHEVYFWFEDAEGSAEFIYYGKKPETESAE